MKRYFTQLTDFQIGILYITLGTFFFLFSLGLLGAFIDTVFMVAALALIAFGIYKTKLHKKIMILFEKPKKH